MPDKAIITERLATLVRDRGLYEAARIVGLSYNTVARIVAGCGTRPGSFAQVAVALGLVPTAISTTPRISA